MLQPNFSTAGIIFIVAVIILFVAGAKLSFMGALFGAGSWGSGRCFFIF